jgi:O-antigen ligase
LIEGGITTDKEKITKYLDKVILASLMFMVFSSTISTAGISTGFCLALLGWVCKIIITRNIKFFKDNPLNKPIVIFLLAMIISLIDSYNMTKSLNVLNKLLSTFVLYYLIINNVSDLKTIKKLFTLGLVSITISSLYGLVWQLFYLKAGIVESMMSTHLDFGALLLVYLLVVMVFFLFGCENIQERLKYGLLIPVIFLTLIFNQTRGAWLGFVAGAFSIFWLHCKKWIWVLLVLIVITVVLVPVQIQNRIKSIPELQNNASNLGRIALWKGAVLMFKDHPINGVGLGNFKKVYLSKYKQPHTDSTAHAHNNFFHYLAETGIIGFTAFIYLLYAILRCLYLNYLERKPGFGKLLVLATLGGVIGVYVIQGFTETNFQRAVVKTTIWLFVALSVVIAKLDKEAES